MAKAKVSRVSAKAKKQAVKRGPAKKAKKPAATKKAANKPAAKKAAPPKAVASTKGKWVYAFGGGRAEGKSDMRNLLGGKGAGLAEMANLGLPVPPGFTISTEACTLYYQDHRRTPESIDREMIANLAKLEKAAAAKESTPVVMTA